MNVIGMEITVEVRSHYGIKANYPVCDTAKLFAELAGTKILTDRAIACIKKLGYTVKVAQTTPTTL